MIAPGLVRQRGVTLEAMMWDGSQASADAISSWLGLRCPIEYFGSRQQRAGAYLAVGVRVAHRGDPIVRYPDRSFDVLTPEIFMQLYEPLRVVVEPA
jgi:hypothetical protein